ncbi:Lsr2 family protein [Gordonia sp. 'Campus']|uniref:histone-like nucleoid-structuring protein Lsr2 n=1 Tax=Gordonia sp. 'Campus' TaxID=2915824 RepID=UPI001EE3B2CC|nr:Lsr2 family protein [Gordonia sp. 'Campus']
MAKTTRVEWVDDFDGKPVGDDDCHRVEFEVKLPGRRAARYALDLRTANLARFEKDINKYIDKATPVRGSGPLPTRGSTGSASSPERSRQIREWAIDNGYEVSARGRIPQSIIDAFNDNH